MGDSLPCSPSSVSVMQKQDLQLVNYKQLPASFEKPRSFNHLLVTEDGIVVKSSKTTAIQGELFFYRTLPSSLKKLFPKLEWWHEDAEGRTFLGMEQIFGSTASSRLVHGLLTVKEFTLVLQGLRKIHEDGCCTNSPLVRRCTIYSNYGAKVMKRRALYPAAYEKAELTEQHFNDLLSMLNEYEDGDHGMFSEVIHGDAVLTNILITGTGCKFIDPRGMQGDEYIISGDRNYDYAKVLQSLIGYDWIINGMEWNEWDVVVCKKLINIFRIQVNDEKRWRWLLVIVASLFTSLIGLHDEGHVQFGLVAKVIVRRLKNTSDNEVIDWVEPLLRNQNVEVTN